MATLQNDRDKALQTAPYRSLTGAVSITGTAGQFLISKNTTTILPTSITLTATTSGLIYTSNAVYSWSYATSANPTTWVALGSNSKTLTINNTDAWIKNASVQYRCIVTETYLDTSYAYYTVNYTAEASDPVIINLSRTNVLVTCDSTGTPLNYTNTDQTITVTRGTTALAYSSNTTTPNSFSVSYTVSNLTASAGTGSGTSWTQPIISSIAIDGAYIVYTITVYDSAATPAATTYSKTVVYNKVSNGSIGADGTNITSVNNYDFAGKLLPVAPAGTTYNWTTDYASTIGDFIGTISGTTLTRTSGGTIAAGQFIGGSTTLALGNGTIGTIVGTGPWTVTITGLTTTSGVQVGVNLSAISTGGGAIFTGATPSSCTVASIVSATSLTYTLVGSSGPLAGSVVSVTAAKVLPGTYVVSGSANTWTINQSQTVASTTLSSTGYTGDSIVTQDSDTTTSLRNIQNLNLNNATLVTANNYLISMRIKRVSGTWTGRVYYTSSGQAESTAYKLIPAPAIGVWTTINLDMRTLDFGTNTYISTGQPNSTVTGLRFNLFSTAVSEVVIDYISVGRYGVAEGTKSQTVSMFVWAPSGTNLTYTGAFTYTWATATISAFPVAWSSGGTPYSWTSAAGTAPNTSYVLYQRNIVLTDVITASTTASNWSASSQYTIGFLGLQGDSARVAYIISTGVWANPAAPTSGVGNVPPTSTFTNAFTAWSFTATGTLSDGQYMYQSDGILNNSTGVITWGNPYLSNLKVGNLSALSANLGVVSVASGGALYSGKSTYADSTNAGFFIGNDSGTPKLKIGDAGFTKGIAWNGTDLEVKGGVLVGQQIKNSTGTFVIDFGATPYISITV